MKTIFGINALTPVNKKLKNGYTMYDWVKRQKCFPAFCMRTIYGEYGITADEIKFLKERACKIGLVIREYRDEAVSSAEGCETAIKAVMRAKEFGIPANAGIALFAEIKFDGNTDLNWMLSFAKTVVESGYVPGFIDNMERTMDSGVAHPFECFSHASMDANRYGAIFMATEPKFDNMPTVWCPYCPSEMDPMDISLWSCGSTTFDLICVEDVYARADTILEKMW